MDASVSSRPGPAPLDHATVRSIVLGVMLAMFLAALDQTIVATALPTIGRELGDLQNIAWVVTAYLLSSTAVTPLYGKLSDIHGRRTVLLIAIAIFIVGSIACALAPTMTGLILARFLQGLGGGGLISLAHTITGDAIPPKERAKYMGYFGAVFASASVAGPVLGGVLSEALHWSVIFWINLPLGLIAFAMTFNALKKLPRNDRPHRLDVVGAVLLVAAAVLLLLALSWGGVNYPWGSLPIISLLLASAAAWVLFVARVLTAPEPFLPVGVLRDQVVATATLAGFFGIGTMVGLSIYMPLFFQSVLHLSAAESGFALIPLSIGTVFGAQFSGRVMARVQHYKRSPTIGLAVAMILTALLAAFAGRMDVISIEIVLAFIGAGLGTLFPVTIVVAQNAVQAHHLGTATATINFMRSLGSAILVAAFGAIFLAGLGAISGGEGGSVEAKIAAAAGAGISLAGAFRGVFIAATICIAISLALLAIMEERPLRSTRGPTPSAVEV
ncbi:MDR family MFS transporter [Kaistia nematophila]|uniref:MDR family MFS transporter n=1 Tax=Kaistia nematophila TaxID=2994654 RepID=A0A9X3E2X4_9HYPH|nr:MDR family MFS transporter [Kaistia nematophila]MCX5570759.1 MDR family MFS transporter [Kaistia nematophila]